MRIIGIGHGTKARILTEFAVREGHDVVLIVDEEAEAEAMATDLDARVLHGHITQGQIIEEAGAKTADALVAMTDDDADNLMAVFLGKKNGIDNLISIVNDTSHNKLFETLGVHILSDPEVIIAKQLYRLVSQNSSEHIFNLTDGTQLVQLSIPSDSPLIGQSVAALEQSVEENLMVLLLQRDAKNIRELQTMELQAGDRIICFSEDVLSEKTLSRLDESLCR